MVCHMLKSLWMYLFSGSLGGIHYFLAEDVTCKEY